MQPTGHQWLSRKNCNKATNTHANPVGVFA